MAKSEIINREKAVGRAYGFLWLLGNRLAWLCGYDQWTPSANRGPPGDLTSEACTLLLRV